MLKNLQSMVETLANEKEISKKNQSNNPYLENHLNKI
jgi:hypothetical protein